MIRAAVIAALVAACAAQDHPHLSQAWQANSVGDGEPGATGLESYIFEGCGHSPQPPTSETCMHAHKWDYGAACVKYEVDAGFKSPYTGVYYVNCDGVDCCKDGTQTKPDLKMWDIGQTKKCVISPGHGPRTQPRKGPIPSTNIVHTMTAVIPRTVAEQHLMNSRAPKTISTPPTDPCRAWGAPRPGALPPFTAARARTAMAFSLQAFHVWR